MSALDVLYSRIPIDLHERELDRVCTQYRTTLSKQLRDLAGEVNGADLINDDEYSAILRAVDRLDHFMPAAQAEASARNQLRKSMNPGDMAGFFDRDSGSTTPTGTNRGDPSSRGSSPQQQQNSRGGGSLLPRGLAQSPSILVAAGGRHDDAAGAAGHKRPLSSDSNSRQQHLGANTSSGAGNNRWTSRTSSIRSGYGEDSPEPGARLGRGMSMTFGEVVEDDYAAAAAAQQSGDASKKYSGAAARLGGSFRRSSSGKYSGRAPQSSAASSVRSDWVHQLEEVYNRVSARRELLKDAIEAVAQHASSANTLRVIASTMWPEVRYALSLVLKDKDVLPMQGVKQVFGRDGGIAAGVEDSMLDVVAAPLMPLDPTAWEEFASDAAPKAAGAETWDLDDASEVADFFAPMEKVGENPFLTLLESLKYELALFGYVQNRKTASGGSSSASTPYGGRDRMQKTSHGARRMLQDAVAKVERLAALYDKEMSDFVNVCRALQRLYVREKRDADGMLALHTKRLETIEQLAAMRAAQIVDDEAFAVASGRRTHTPDVTIGGAEMRRGTLVCDVGVRCRVEKSTLLEDLDKMIHDTNLRQHRIKRFVDYIDNFVDSVEKFDDGVDNALRCPICKEMSVELISMWPCGCTYCLRCVPEPENNDEGAAYGAYCDVCGASTKDSHVVNPNASGIAAKVRFRHSSCSELRSSAQKLRAVFGSLHRGD